MKDFQDLAREIKAARTKLEYTLQTLATKTQLDKSYLSKIENNKLTYPPSERAIANLAKALELDGDRLNLLAGHIPMGIKPVVCEFLVVTGDRASEILNEAIRSVENVN